MTVNFNIIHLRQTFSSLKKDRSSRNCAQNPQKINFTVKQPLIKSCIISIRAFAPCRNFYFRFLDLSHASENFPQDFLTFRTCAKTLCKIFQAFARVRKLPAGFFKLSHACENSPQDFLDFRTRAKTLRNIFWTFARVRKV